MMRCATFTTRWRLWCSVGVQMVYQTVALLRGITVLNAELKSANNILREVLCVSMCAKVRYRADVMQPPWSVCPISKLGPVEWQFSARTRQESARDRWVQQQIKEARRHLPDDLDVLLSPLLLEQMAREAA
ncbi:hypothetical protein XENOCAPTIV_004277 [Xenoophorus captivus]|uniref:Secreted protein n=1 Tax=Xenoophorus captivus TaxID=1517983 RepID=A0ABV0QQN8_9TELE